MGPRNAISSRPALSNIIEEFDMLGRRHDFPLRCSLAYVRMCVLKRNKFEIERVAMWNEVFYSRNTL